MDYSAESVNCGVFQFIMTASSSLGFRKLANNLSMSDPITSKRKAN